MKIAVTDLDAEIIPRTAREVALAALRGNWDNLRQVMQAPAECTFTLTEIVSMEIPMELLKPLVEQVAAEALQGAKL